MRLTVQPNSCFSYNSLACYVNIIMLGRRCFVLFAETLNSVQKVCLSGFTQTANRGPGVLPIMAYSGEAPPKRVTFYRLQIYERVGIHKGPIT